MKARATITAELLGCRGILFHADGLLAMVWLGQTTCLLASSTRWQARSCKGAGFHDFGVLPLRHLCSTPTFNVDRSFPALGHLTNPATK